MSSDVKLGTVVGLPMDRVDGRLKVTGGAKYSADIPVQGVTYAVLVKSTIAKGKVTKIDASDAKSAQGVIAVLTYEDKDMLPEAQRGKILPGPEVHFSGQDLAVVIADTLEHATEAAGLVKIDYAPEAPASVMTPDLLPSAHPPASNGRRVTFERGDVTSGLSAGSARVQQVYTTPVEHHNPLEPHATLAVWEGDKLTVYDATQGVTGTQRTLSSLFGIPTQNVRVVSHFLGGGFGCKGMSWPHVSTAAFAAKVVGRPVKLVLRREQMFTSNGHRPETRQEITLAAGKDGRLTAWSQSSYTEVSPVLEFIEPVGLMPSIMYAVPNLKIDHHLVTLDVPPGTYMRAPGEASGSVGCEIAMDELAYELSLDPIELRMRNYAEADPQSKLPWSSNSLRECYAKGAEAFGWSKRKPTPGRNKDGKWLVGYGVASATYPANYQPASASAQMMADGSVLIRCGTQDLGTGSYTILTQIAADVLGVQPDRVRTEIGDSSLPMAPGSGGSTSAASAGSGVYVAALALRSKLISMAIGDGKVEDVQVHNGVLAIPGGPRSMSYADIVRKSGQPSIEVTTKAEARSNDRSMHSFGAQFAEVHVDADLGTIRVAKCVGAFGVGRVLNAKTAESQLRGGIIWGIGMALLEETLMDPHFGRYVNMNLGEYHVPVNADIPDIQVLTVPEEDPYVNAIGVKGIGEIGIVGCAAAIANAIFNATGKRVRSLPITLDKLM